MKLFHSVLMVCAYLPGLSYSNPRRNSKQMRIEDAPSHSKYVRTETDRRGHGRQIQPLACVSKTGSEKGVCMFAWNCVEAGGKHLGTCIDRFYFGSCCKLPGNSEYSPATNNVASEVSNSIDSDDSGDKEMDNDVSENEISDEAVSLKPIGGSISSSDRKSTTTTTTTTLSLSPITTTTTTTTSTTTTSTTTTSTTTTTTTTTTSTTTTSTTTTTTTTQKPTTPTTTSTTTSTTTTSTSTTSTTTTSSTTSTTELTTTTSTTTITASTTSTTRSTTTTSNAMSTVQTTETVLDDVQTTESQTTITAQEAESMNNESERPSTDVADTTVQPVGSTDAVVSTTDKLQILDTEVSQDVEEGSGVISADGVTSSDSGIDTTQKDESVETTVSPAQVEEKQTTTSSVDSSSSDDVESTTSTKTNDDAASIQEVPTVAPVISDTTDGDLTVDPVVVESADDEFSTNTTDDETKPNTDSSVILQAGPDGSLQHAPGIGGVKPENGQFYNCSIVSEGVFNCSIVNGPGKGESLVTDNLNDIKNLIDSSGGGIGKPVIIDYEEVKGPEAPAAPAVTPSPTDKPTEQTTQPTRESSTEKPLHSMTFKEACGRTPWLNDTFRSIHASPRSGRKIGGNSNTGHLWKQLNRRGKIVNGEKAEYGEWPWQVSLRQWRTATFLHKCGAALLSENWAITAAHCVESVNPDELLLRMGEYDLNDEFPEPYTFQDRKVQIVASHPKFDPKTFEYDLALLRFYEPVTFQPNIIPVCIPEDDANLVGKTAWVTGWGRLYEDGPLPAVLQEVDLPIINNTECEAMYEKAGFREHIPHIFICAGYREGGKDSCEGDSGGPMSVRRDDDRFMLSGIISWGIGCAEKNQPGVYTRISEFKDWINQILQY